LRSRIERLPEQFRYVRLKTDLESRHIQELLPGIAILLDGGIVDIKEGVAYSVGNPHGMRIGSEWQPEQFALWRGSRFQRGVMSHSLNASPLPAA
jgi:hypothetical protein